MKKLICLILVLTVVLSSVSVFAGKYYDGYDFMNSVFKYDVGDFVAGEGEGADGAVDEEAKLMMFLETLGLWDDASIPYTELVSMQAFSKIMSKLKLGIDNAFTGVYDLNPSEEYTTYNHAYTYLVEALGYSYKCNQYPGAKDANLIVAAEIGLLNERPENINTYITRGELAKLIHKAMNMDLCVIEYPDEGGYRYSVVEGKTLLNSVHDIFLTEGFVNGIPGLNVYGAEKIRDGYVQINRHDIKNGGIDVAKYFGSYVQAYTKYDSVRDEYTIIAIEQNKDYEIFEIDFTDLTYVNDSEIGYLDELGNELVYNVSNIRNVIENGEMLNSISDICDFSRNEGVIKFSASTKSGDIDTAVIYKYNYFVVNNVDTRLFRIGLRYNRQYDGLPYIQLDDKAPMDVYIDGNKADYSALTTGSVIKFFSCSSTGYVYIDAVSLGVSDGEPEMLYDNIVALDGEEYRLARDWEIFVQENKDNTSIISSQRPTELVLGINTTFYVIDGIIAAYTTSQSYTYGYIKSISQSRTSVDPDLTFRVFTEDGEWENYVLNKSIEFEGQANVPKEDIIAAINTDGRTYDFFDHPIRFRANGDKELLALDTVYESQFEVATEDDIKLTQYCAIRSMHGREAIGIDNPFYLSEKTIIFVCPDGSDDESDYKVITNQQMPAANYANQLPTKIYNINDYCQISLMVMTKKLDASSSSKKYYYIQKITNVVLDADNQILGYKVSGKMFNHSGRANGNLKDFYFYADEKMINKNEVGPNEEGYTTDNILEVGDFISATVSVSEVVSWDMMLKGGVVPTPTPADDGASDRKIITDGEIYVATGKFVRADAETDVWVTNVDGVNMPSVPSVKAIINPTTHEIVQVDVSDFFEGDNVYYHWERAYGNFYIKNEY